MTYSVVMRAGDSVGVAVQSHWFNVASVVPWVEGGVGAVATQSIADPTYGPRALALLRDGTSARVALDRLLAEDDAAERRQVSIVDWSGDVATHTGSGCIEHAAHIVGDGWSVQANIMRDGGVVPAMADAAANATGPILDRLFAVLRAAEAAGGDLRGSQSAAVLVADTGQVPTARLSVDDHADPIGELGRLIEIRRLYDAMEIGDDALSAGKLDDAAIAYDRAARSPHANDEVRFWQALGLAGMGRLDDATTVLQCVVRSNPDHIELLDRLAEVALVEPSVAHRLRAALDDA